MTGTTISSISAVEIRIRSRCCIAMSPDGFITTQSQAVSGSARSGADLRKVGVQPRKVGCGMGRAYRFREESNSGQFVLLYAGAKNA
ncbi:hypothetical protein Sj15T_13850 [Sphingobium sp. TA15]|nr:hypothetical protein Sj15T_13850 [Sphingobium sp. TA15]